MIVTLRLLAVAVLVAMLAVTIWAGAQCPLFAVPRPVLTHPWFIATLFDAFFGFLTFYVWAFYKRTHWLARLAWLIAILILGNIALAAFSLSELCSVPRTAPFSEVLTRRTHRIGLLGPLLAAAGIAVLFLA
ncbi:DUF1475 domain-containing protein [Horticoccus luteus]|uniref:DUF1475 domain-containing protein n=1 Tax=Horticoccus luteus TaxID=2862869 RepID=A0A8F9TWC9_9BACT|nr:DUF1475 family protein [Horticoccus luteus]QYM79287.1 DUF1475 domain-containing protein [Horticoccus luteus]